MRKAGAILMAVALLAGCATAPGESDSRPFYYFHTNYPEQMDNDAGCHGCRSRYSDEYAEEQSGGGFSERERSYRMQKLYRKMGR